MIFDEKIVPNGVGTGRPPANALPPRNVWQLLQLPMAASSRPRLTMSASKAGACGRSIADIAGRHMTANAATAPPIMNPAARPAIVRRFTIRPSFSCFGTMLSQIRRSRATPALADQITGQAQNRAEIRLPLPI